MVPVILFHVGFNTFSGGFVGVDIFFVISGYLITSLILSDLEKRKFKLLHFYERRARRILPALICVMLTCIPLSWMTMVPFQLKDISQSLLATLAFFSNYLFFIESGYFKPEAELKPLLHTWSLAVEEQYYIIFPVLVLFLFQMGAWLSNRVPRFATRLDWLCRRNLISIFLIALVCFSMALISIFWSQWNVAHNSGAAFYLLPSRGWEILIGALSAIYLHKRQQITSMPLSPVSNIMSALGIICIVVSVFLFDKRTLFPGINALLPVAGTVLILLFCSPATLAHRILSHKILIGMGLISYSAYLWHQPLIAFTRLEFGMDLSLPQSITILVATVVLSIISWRYIEIPARRTATLNATVLFPMCATAITIIVAFAIVGLKTNGFYNAKLATIPEEFANYVIDREDEFRQRRSLLKLELDKQEDFFTHSADSKKVLIIGDSISRGLMMSINTIPWRAADVEFRHMRLDDSCVASATAALMNDDFIPQTSPGCRKEVLSLLNSELYQHAEEIVVHSNFQPDNVYTIEPFIQALAEDEKRVSVVGLLVFNDISSVSMNLHDRTRTPKQVYYEALRSKYLDVNELLQMYVGKISGARYLDKLSLFCDKATKQCDISDDNNRPVIIDGNHFTVDGFSILGRKIQDAMWFSVDSDAAF